MVEAKIEIRTTLETALRNYPGLNDWTLNEETTRSWQLYMIGLENECVRQVQTTRWILSLYRDHEGGRGSAQLSIVESDIPRLPEKLTEAFFSAGLSGNPHYDLPGPSTYPVVETVDQRLLEGGPQNIAILREDALATLKGKDDIVLSQLELFLEYRQVDFSNSKGAQGQREGTRLLFDVNLLALPLVEGDREAESHTMVEVRRLDDLDLKAVLEEQITFARDSRNVVEPETLQGVVVLSGIDLPNLFSPFLTHSAASMKYSEQSLFVPGRSFAGDVPLLGEPLDLFADALLPNGLGTVAFDSDGVPGQRVQLIEKSIFRNFWASQRYASYLKIPATGYYGNIVVPPGQRTLEDLCSGPGPVYHVVTLSALMPNDQSGDFVAEIKLGYEYRDGKMVRVLKGGSVSGNVFTAFAHASFSKEVVPQAEYYGPKAIRFENLTVSGV